MAEKDNFVKNRSSLHILFFKSIIENIEFNISIIGVIMFPRIFHRKLMFFCLLTGTTLVDVNAMSKGDSDDESAVHTDKRRRVVPDRDGNTPLLAACVQGKFEFAEQLLNGGGIDLDVKNKEGQDVINVLANFMTKLVEKPAKDRTASDRTAYESCYEFFRKTLTAYKYAADGYCEQWQDYEDLLCDLEVAYFTMWPLTLCHPREPQLSDSL